MTYRSSMLCISSSCFIVRKIENVEFGFRRQTTGYGRLLQGRSYGWVCEQAAMPLALLSFRKTGVW